MAWFDRRLVSLAVAAVVLFCRTSGYAQDRSSFTRNVMPGDRLRIAVAEQPDLNRVYTVAGDGTIDFGFLGRISIAEMSAQDAASRIESLLEQTYFKQATVSVSVDEFVEGAILVVGAVRNPGAVSFKGGDILTLTEALTMSGGMTREAAGTEVKILRWKPGAGMERQIITVDVQSMFETLDFGNDQYLRPRDIVMVPTLGGQGKAEFLALGDVVSPGFHPWSQDLDLIRAVTRVGGISKSARWDSVRILRPDARGNYAVIPVNLARLFGAADMSMNVKILAGDILFVPSAEHSGRGQVFLLGEVAKPGAIQLSMNDNDTLAKTILANGGFGKFANDSKVRLLRTAPDGSKQTLFVDVGRILKTGSFEDDVPLENGDVVIVSEKVLSF